MAIHGKEFVDFAYEMLQQKNDIKEVEVRTIMGRAYYGAHHVAKKAAGIVDTTGQVHRLVLTHYANQPRIYNDLNMLFINRKIADYEIDSNEAYAGTKFKLRDARSTCRKAKKILDLLGA